MKNFRYHFGCAIACLFIVTSRGQAFRNLDFEQGAISAPPPNQLSTSIALPGWQVYLNGSPSDTILYDTIALDKWAVSIHDSMTTYVPPPIDGKFYVLLQGGREPVISPPGMVFGAGEIAQVGAIDSGSHSLLFSAYLTGPDLNVSFKGQSLPIYVLGTSPNFKTYGADISAFAGQPGELRFTTPYGTWAYLDDIQFSTQVIPEPSTFALLATGAALFGIGYRSHRSQ